MREAGFRSVHSEAADVWQVFPSLETFVEFQENIGAAEVFARLQARDRSRLRARLTRAYRRFESSTGIVRVPAMAWVASAVR